MSEILFAGGVTGGHLFPGLAVADALREIEPSWQITFAGTGRSLERRHVHAAGHDYVAIDSSPRPSRLIEWPGFATTMARGLWAAGSLIQQHQPRLVVGLGGYASVPVAWQASRHGVPLVLLEQNILPGRANRWLATRADRIILPAEATLQHWPEAASRSLVLGNPVRSAFVKLAERKLGDERRTLLVLGGSGGARSLNRALPVTLARVGQALRGWQVIHQTGMDDVEATQTRYAQLKIPARVVAFLDNLPTLLTQTGLVVSRAGGTTLAELATTQTPTVLCPFPHAADDHQRINAEHFAALGGAVVVDERDNPPRFVERLAFTLQQLLVDASLRTKLREGMSHGARPEAAQAIAQALVELVEYKRRRAA